MIILSIDPGFGRLGVAVLDAKNRSKPEIVFSDCVETGSKLAFEKRLLKIGQTVSELILKYKPDVVAIETLYFSTNEKTALQVAEARGVILYVVAEAGIPIREFGPGEVKVAVTGYGKSDKKAVMSMVPRLVTLPVKKMLDDELDAIAVGLTCIATHK